MTPRSAARSLAPSRNSRKRRRQHIVDDHADDAGLFGTERGPAAGLVANQFGGGAHALACRVGNADVVDVVQHDRNRCLRDPSRVRHLRHGYALVHLIPHIPSLAWTPPLFTYRRGGEHANLVLVSSQTGVQPPSCPFPQDNLLL